MKKMGFIFLVLFTSIILAIQSPGQSSKVDSVKTDLNLSSKVVSNANASMNSPNLISEFTATIWSILIGIFILSLFAIPYYFNLKKAKARQQIISKLIEKDRDIPKELLSKPQKTRRSDLHKGIVLIAFGLSLCIVIFILRIHSNFWTIGLIPIFIGLGYVISFKLDHSFKTKSEID